MSETTNGVANGYDRQIAHQTDARASAHLALLQGVDPDAVALAVERTAPLLRVLHKIGDPRPILAQLSDGRGTWHRWAGVTPAGGHSLAGLAVACYLQGLRDGFGAASGRDGAARADQLETAVSEVNA